MIFGIALSWSCRYIVLLDAGTVPAPTALLRLYCDMEFDPQIGGCCGEIIVDASQRSIISPVVMAQHFEYTMAK
jgi:chitin synthase